MPVFVDFAVMREAARDLGGDPARINPQIPCDLVIDHSVIADVAGCCCAMPRRTWIWNSSATASAISFLKWAQSSFQNVRIVPPGAGICHQLNVERFARGAMTKADRNAGELAYFDTLVGTDSAIRTTANGIGVLCWGVGGIEAEAAALGQPITTLVPQVVGVRLTGELPDGVAAMDAGAHVRADVACEGRGRQVRRMLRRWPVATLSNATQRACIANMTPEYGCTCTLFPVDDRTLAYLLLTGRAKNRLRWLRQYAKAQGMWNDRRIARVRRGARADLCSEVECIAGPRRPHDRFARSDVRSRFNAICADRKLDMGKRVAVNFMGTEYELTHGAIAIAAVTSCTTATDPAMMLACGLVAKHAPRARPACQALGEARYGSGFACDPAHARACRLGAAPC